MNQCLPPDCFYAIFARLPSRYLIRTVPLVCRHWAHLQPEPCRRVRSLILGDQEKWRVSYPNELRITRYCPITARKLSSLFPRINRLVLEVDTREDTDDGAVRSLLKHWSPHLIQLKLTCTIRSSELREIIHTLNSDCVALKQLEFTVECHGSNRPVSFDLSLVARLDELKFRGRNQSSRSLLASLGKHRSETLSHLEIDLDYGSEPNTIRLLNQLSTLNADDSVYKGARMLQNLKLATPAHIRLIGNHLPHLRILCLYRIYRSEYQRENSRPIWLYSSILSQLKELHTIRLNILTPGYIEKTPFTDISPLYSVRHLELEVDSGICQHDWLTELLRPGELLPALETVHYELTQAGNSAKYECATCSTSYVFVSKNYWDLPPHQWEETDLESFCFGTVCLQAALTPFNECTHLKQRILSYPKKSYAEYLERIRSEKDLLPGWLLVGRQ